MPYRRKYSRRRRVLRRPRRYIRRSRLPRSLPYRRQKIHNFKRHFVTTWTLASAAVTTNQWAFMLGSLPNYTDFTNLFDQYRMKAVSMSIIPRFSEVDQTTRTDTQLYSVIDRNDSTALASVNEALEYESCKHTKISKTHRRYFKLNTLSDVGSSAGGGTGFIATKFSPWINSANTNIWHYGCKTIADATGIGANCVMDVYFTVYIQCRNVK